MNPDPELLNPTQRPARRRHGRRIALVAGAVLAVLVLVATTFAFQYRGQIWSYMTHWKGSPTHTVAYRTFEETPDLHLAVAGDIGDSGSRLDATGRAMAAVNKEQPYQALLLLGDNVYPSGDPKKIPDTVFRPFASVLESARLLAILGNHDVKDGNGDEQMKVLGMSGRWWSEVLDDTLIVGLDSNDPTNPHQLAFLDKVLDGSHERWKIVALHHPPYSAGYQGSSMEVRRIFAPIFEKYDVQLVLSGHDHDYQRSKPMGGVTYVVSGAASGTRRTGEEGFTAESFSWHHFLDIAIFPDRLVGRAVNQDQRVADTFIIRP